MTTAALPKQKTPVTRITAEAVPALAFAVSTAAHNDILLIDEGIGAGDAAFREKARQRIESLFDRTPIVLLASHSEGLVAEFCNRRVTMEHGKIRMDGLPDEVLGAYRKSTGS